MPDLAHISQYGLAFLVVCLLGGLKWMHGAWKSDREEWKEERDYIRSELKAEREGHQKTREAQLLDVRTQAAQADLLQDIQNKLAVLSSTRSAA